jgi:phage terminase small subunit
MKTLPAARPVKLRDYELGPDMLALTDKQRNFVFHLMEAGGTNFTRAAALAGYTGTADALASHASRLAHDEKIGRAMFEEAKRRLAASAILAVSELHKVLNDPLAKMNIKLRAIQMVLDRVGMGTSQTHVVKHEVTVSEEERLENIRDMAARLNLNADKLLGSYGITIEGSLTDDDPLAITHDEDEEW